MTKKPSKKPKDEVEPTVLEEPTGQDQAEDRDEDDEEQNVWMRGLWMIVLAILFGVGEAILGLAAILQFLWLLFGKEKNEQIAAFGKDLADWLARVAEFQTGTTEEKPFPFMKWGPKD